MAHTTIGSVTFGVISNVRKSGDEEGVFFADIEISPSEGFPFDTHIYCARSDDYAPTGKWVYQQILDGNFVGEVTNLVAGADPATGLPYPDQVQPTMVGAQNL